MAIKSSKINVEHTPQTSYDTTAIFTIPNVLSFLRLIGVPLFLWLVLGPKTEASDFWAVGVLILASLTDLVDGKLARAFNQVSRLGQMLDPVADRLYILAIVIALGIRGLLAWQLVAVLLARDVFLACLVPVLKKSGYTSLPVHFIGKAATFLLLTALPLVLLGAYQNVIGEVARIIGWAAALWGVAMYWWAGILYLRQTVALNRVGK